MPTPPPVGMPTDIVDLRTRTTMPEVRFDQLWDERKGYVEGVAADTLEEIYSRLRKRYRVPMIPIPGQVLKWRAKLATPDLYDAIGRDPDDPSIDDIEAAAEKAREQIKEAADSETGLYDLPLLSTADASAIAKESTLFYSEASPYESVDRQYEAIRGR